jgi:S-DNA-T family DNA segregation ATPase FtsK/SpoIIIE
MAVPWGVHFVISVDQRSGMPTSLAAAVQRRVVLRMAHADDYAFLAVAGDVLSMASPPDRGLLNGEEIQCGVLGGTAEVMAQSRAVSAFGEVARRAGTGLAHPIGSLTDRVLMSDLPAEIDGQPVLGVGSTTLTACSFEPRGSFVVTGPSRSGRTTSLASMARALTRWSPAIRLYLFSPRRSSELAALAEWTEVAPDPDVIAVLAARLQAELREGSARALMSVVVERADDLAGSAAEAPLSGLVKACLEHGQFVVAEGESMFFSSSFGLPGLLKTSRSGLALQPESAEGQTVFRSIFPAASRAELPPGRGFLVQHGRPQLLQVGLASEI